MSKRQPSRIDGAADAADDGVGLEHGRGDAALGEHVGGGEARPGPAPMITTSCSLAGSGSGVESLTDEHSGRKGSGEASVGTGVAARAVYGARPRHPRLLELLPPASGSLLGPASGTLLCPESGSLLCT